MIGDKVSLGFLLLSQPCRNKQTEKRSTWRAGWSIYGSRPRMHGWPPKPWPCRHCPRRIGRQLSGVRWLWNLARANPFAAPHFTTYEMHRSVRNRADILVCISNSRCGTYLPSCNPEENRLRAPSARNSHRLCLLESTAPIPPRLDFASVCPVKNHKE